MTLKDLEVGQSARVVSVGGTGALRQHFLDMGVIPGVEVTLEKLAPMGDPMELHLRGYALTLRLDDAEKIHVNGVETANRLQTNNSSISRSRVKHPGFGQSGIYHIHTSEQVLPEGEMLTFALVGNQNCGKTTLFNHLTGANQHVGNFPGVTVDRKDGTIRGYSNTLVTDLPGIYSMSPYSSEELVTRRFILEEKPKAIINIIDATNIERNLYLTMQLMELNVPMVLALNMMDEVRASGGSIAINELERLLGIPVVPISAVRGEGIGELIDHAVHVARFQEKPGRQDFCDPFSRNDISNFGAVHRCLHAIMHLIEDHARTAFIPVRFAASKLAEGDQNILTSLELDENEKKTLEHIVRQMEEERQLDRSAAIADMRFRFIEEVCTGTVVKAGESKSRARSRKIDRILTGKYTAIPLFAVIMAAVFWLTFGVIGSWMSVFLKLGISWFTQFVDHILLEYGLNPVIRSLVIDGVFHGVGSVLSFLPVIVTLFFFLSILEDTGYMARVAFVMDKLLRKMGLSGRSIVPMLIGFGCTVPGVMATRTLPSDRDRKMTILLTPFMSCTAKVPIYGYFSAAFFPEHSVWVMIGLYFGGMVMAIVMAMLFRKTVFRGEPVPFVMELPNYRFPGIRNVAMLLWEKAKDFLTRAFTVIFVATIIIWFLQTFDMRLNVVAQSQDSMLASIAGLVSPIFAPLGFGNWQISTALITGFMAKESVVATLTVLLGSCSVSSFITPLTAVSLLVFTLLYTPCIAAISAVKREMGAHWAIGVVFGQCMIAWIIALLVRTCGLLLGFI